MSSLVTLEISEEIANLARGVAVRTNRRLEDVLTELLAHGAKELPIEWLPDETVLALSYGMLPEDQQAELSELLHGNSNGTLTDEEHIHLDELMEIYEEGLLRKAQAIKVAVERGLRPRLDQE